MICFETFLQVLILKKLARDECSPIRRQAMRLMALRELGLEPLQELAVGDRATCDWRTVHGTCGWFRVRNWRRRL